jgi:hypothetical protein
MMRMLRTAAAGIGLVLALASCDVLFMGIFPSSLGQATAAVDLSASIDPAAASTFNLSIARSYGFEFAILYSTAGFDATKPHVIVLSPGLKVLNTYSLADVNLIVSPASFSGSTVFAHLVDGHIVIGNADGVATSRGLKLIGPLPGGLPLNGWTIIGGQLPSMSAYAWIGFQVNQTTNTLTYSPFDIGWFPVAPPPVNLPWLVRPLDASHGPLDLDGVFTNPEDELGNTSLFVFGDRNAGAEWFVQIPKSPDLEAPPTTPIFSGAYPTFSKEELDSRSIAVTRDGIVAFQYSTQSWIKFTPAAPQTVTSLYVGRRGSHQQSAFSFSGGWYCIWDPETRTLVRYEDWW